MAAVHIYRGPPEKKGGDGNPGHVHNLTRHNHKNSKKPGRETPVTLFLGWKRLWILLDFM